MISKRSVKHPPESLNRETPGRVWDGNGIIPGHDKGYFYEMNTFYDTMRVGAGARKRFQFRKN